MPHKTKEARAAYQRQYKLDHPAMYADAQVRYRAAGKRRATDIHRLFGITQEIYEILFKAQRGLCKICGNPETRRSKSGELLRLAVDHDHETDTLRGLLCASCNAALGLLKDSVEILRKAADYLERSKL